MRVLQIISSSETSGAEHHVLSVSQQLRAGGHETEVICKPGWLRTALLIGRQVREKEFDLIHSHLTRATYIAAVGSMLARVPLLATVHVSNRDPIYKLVAKRRNKLIAVSNYIRGMLYGRGVPDRFIETVYNGTDFLDAPLHNGRELKNELRLPNDSRLIGLVGRVCRDKGHLLLISALPSVIKEHSKAHMLFVGRVDANFETELDSSIYTAGVEKNITFTGNRHDVPRLLDACEFTAMPSRREAFGVAAIEAMARERPVIASRIGGLPEVVRHGQTGLLFDLRANEVSDALHYMLSHREECRQMGKWGRDLVAERFTLNHMMDRLEGIYKSSLTSISN